MFATADELATRLDVEFTEDDTTRAEALLEGATGMVQAAARQRIERVVDDEFRLRGRRETSVLLPERPIDAISSVTLKGQALAASSWWLEGDELVRPAGFGGSRDELVIIYTHGFDPIPTALKEIVLSAATRAWSNPEGVMSERLGQAQITYALQGTPPGMGLTTDERRTVRALTRRGARSLTAS